MRLALCVVLALIGSAAAAPQRSTRTRTRRPSRTRSSSIQSPTIGTALSLSPSETTSVAVPPVAAIPPASVAGGTIKSLSLSSTIIDDLNNIGIGAPVITSRSGVEINADIYIVDMAGHSAAQIQTYKDAGKTVMCYFSAGTTTASGSDASEFGAECICEAGGTLDANNECVGGPGNTKLGTWGVYWLDIHSETCKAKVHAVQAQRIKKAKAKGCDGMDPDNVDSYAYNSPHGSTEADQIEYLLWIAQTVHAEGMLVVLKNSPALIGGASGPALVDAFDLSVNESCRVFNECYYYDPFLAAGKPMLMIEYSSSIKSCPADLKPGQTLAVYSGKVVGSEDVTLYCPSKAA